MTFSNETAFEASLARAFSDYADRAPIHIDTAALARAVAAHDRRTFSVVGRSFTRPRWLTPVAIALLLLATLAAAAYVGSLVLERILRADDIDQAPVTILPTGRLAYESLEPKAIAVAGGRVMVVGLEPVSGRRSGQVVDVASGTVESRVLLPDSFTDAVIASLTVLADERVLIVGYRHALDPGTGESVAGVIDPVKGTFTQLGPMIYQRLEPTAVRLADGHVLIAGGITDGPESEVLPDAELFDPSTMTFSPTEPMVTARDWQAMLLLDDGRVLVIGGFCGDPAQPKWCDSVELFDPTAGTFTKTDGNLSHVRGIPALFTRSDGQVLILRLGRYSQERQLFGRHGVDPVTTEIFDPSTGEFTPGPLVPHTVMTATRLTDGRLLLSGAWDISPDVDSPDAGTSDSWVAVFDPMSGTVTELPGVDRLYAAAALLDDGSVALIEAAEFDDLPPNAIDVFVGD
ncbi:MAG: hypothetical protein QOJ81_1219 [Chloroflexota bacterium]|jgi:hypothetical protein|nr:hypothetical protein [Chloroflexota bacterium]